MVRGFEIWLTSGMKISQPPIRYYSRSTDHSQTAQSIQPEEIIHAYFTVYNGTMNILLDSVCCYICKQQSFSCLVTCLKRESLSLSFFSYSPVFTTSSRARPSRRPYNATSSDFWTLSTFLPLKWYKKHS